MGFKIVRDFHAGISARKSLNPIKTVSFAQLLDIFGQGLPKDIIAQIYEYYVCEMIPIYRKKMHQYIEDVHRELLTIFDMAGHKFGPSYAHEIAGATYY